MGSTSSNRLIVSILVIAALAIGFWVLLLGPKREKADELGKQVEALSLSLAETQSQASEAEAARRDFPTDYRQLVVLGPAVPASDETPSLLIELNHVATRAKLKFESISLNASGEVATSTPTPVPTTPAPESSASESSGAVPAAAAIPPTEAAASLLPLGATVGPASLAVMPYNLSFTGSFFHVADFIKGIDGLVHTGGRQVAVDGRLVTLDGFALNPDTERGFPHLTATFAVTTYVIPPGQGLTAGANPTEPAPVAATESGAETGSEEPSATSETTAAR